MENLFDFNYETQRITNKDNSASRFAVVYGQGGNVMHCKKDSYELIQTSELSKLGHAFIDKGHNVKSFVHRNGETIGLNILFGQQMTKVGDMQYNALITVPNNGGGKGFLTIKEERLVCTNGMVRSGFKMADKSIRIPHTLGYENAISLMKKSLVQFEHILTDMHGYDEMLSKQKISQTQARFMLNKWFYEMELPTSQKDMDFNTFREIVSLRPGDLKSIERYNQLMVAFDWELKYLLEDQKMELSAYTVMAVVNNYLSRRIEASQSTASQEVQFTRTAKKVEGFNFANIEG